MEPIPFSAAVSAAAAVLILAVNTRSPHPPSRTCSTRMSSPTGVSPFNTTSPRDKQRCCACLLSTCREGSAERSAWQFKSLSIHHLMASLTTREFKSNANAQVTLIRLQHSYLHCSRNKLGWKLPLHADRATAALKNSHSDSGMLVNRTLSWAECSITSPRHNDIQVKSEWLLCSSTMVNWS